VHRTRNSSQKAVSDHHVRLLGLVTNKGTTVTTEKQSAKIGFWGFEEPERRW
jgi:hypothetical protein